MRSRHNFKMYVTSSIWQMWRQTTSSASKKYQDVHTRLMKKNYEEVPHWWFYFLLLIVIGLSIYACEGFDKQLQLPWWGVLLACGISLLFTLPVGVIQATTNQVCEINFSYRFQTLSSSLPAFSHRNGIGYVGQDVNSLSVCIGILIENNINFDFLSCAATWTQCHH